MEIMTNILVPTGLAIGYFLVFLQTKKGGAGYLIVVFCSLALSATYAYEAYRDPAPDRCEYLLDSRN